MTSKTIIAGILLLTASMIISSSLVPVMAVDKVTVCHIDKKGNAKTIEIQPNKLKSHLAHGDIEGPCRGDYVSWIHLEARLSCTEDNQDVSGIGFIGISIDGSGGPTTQIAELHCNGANPFTELTTEENLTTSFPKDQFGLLIQCENRTDVKRTFTDFDWKDEFFSGTLNCNLPGKGTTTLIVNGYVR